MSEATMKNLLKSCLLLILVVYVTLGQDEFEFRRRASPFTFRDDSDVPTPEDPDGDGVVGAAGKDYPVLRLAPSTSFTCGGKIPGMYADMETGCQVYHVCQADMRKDSRLCVNGTVFNQATFSCDWWYNVDCRASATFYGLNADLGKQPSNAHHRKGTIAFPTELNNLKKPPHVSIPTFPPPPPPPSFSTDAMLDLPRRIPNFPRIKPQLNLDIPELPRQPPVKKIRPPHQFVEDLPERIPQPPKLRFLDDIPTPPRIRPPTPDDRPRGPRPKPFEQEQLSRRPSRPLPKPEGPPNRLKPRPGDPHYGRDAFNPAIHLPRPKPTSEKKFPKPTGLKLDRSPMMQPVKSEDTVAGYSDLYLGKPVDED